MRLLADWEHIVRKAWSFRLNALAAVLMAAEIVLPLYVDSIPRSMFAFLSVAAVLGGMWARVTQQKAFRHE